MKVLISEKLSPHKYKTPEGYLICVDAILARTGKQTYRRNELFTDGDDSEVEVDRKPEEVFAKETLASFENKPVTVEHPDEDVNSGNIKDYAVGFVRDVHKGVVDGQDVILGTLVIQDEQTIEEIENGEHTELSCGYDCDIIDEENPQQKHIRGNHVALCESGRAGNARIVDSKMKDEALYMIIDKDEGKYIYNIDLHNGKYNTTNDAIKAGKYTIDNARKIINELKKYNFNLTSSEYLGDSVKDAQDYVINFRNDYEGFREKTFVNANSAIDALKKFAKEVALRGWGTRNITIISISPNDGYIRLYGNLYDLLKSKDFNDSIKDELYNGYRIDKELNEYVVYDKHYNKEYGRYKSLEEAKINCKYNTFDSVNDGIDVGSLVKDLVHNDQIRISSWTDDGKITLDPDQLYSTDVNQLCRVIKQRGYNCKILNTRTVKVSDELVQSGSEKAFKKNITTEIKDELYSLQELREMRVDNYRGTDIYKIYGQYSTNPNTSNRRFNTLEQVKDYINNGFRDSVRDSNLSNAYAEIKRFYPNAKVSMTNNTLIVSNVNELGSGIKNFLTNLNKKYGRPVSGFDGRLTEEPHITNNEALLFIKDSVRDSNLSNAYAEIKRFYPNAKVSMTNNTLIVSNVNELGSGIKNFLTNLNKKYGRPVSGFDGRLTEEPHITNNEALLFIKDSVRDVEPSEEEIKEYMKKTGFSYIAAKRALEEDNSYFVEKMRKSQYDSVIPTKESSNDKVIYTLQSNVDSNLYFYIGKQYAVKDGQFTYNKFKLEGTSPEQLKNELISNGWKLVNRGYITVIDIKDNKPVIEAKGIWEYDKVKEDWYDTGRKMYYEEIKREHLMDEETPYEEVTKSLEKNINDAYLIQSKYNNENYLQEDNHWGMNKKYAQKFNSYEEAARKANILYSDWNKHVNIIKDSKKFRDEQTISRWTKKLSNGTPIDSAIIKYNDKTYTFVSGIIKEDKDFNSLDEAEIYAKKLGYKIKDSISKIVKLINIIRR